MKNRTEPLSGNKFRYEYQIKDQRDVAPLNDLRVACRCGDPRAGGGQDITKVVQEDSFDPWGLTFGTSNERQTPDILTNRFQFLGREKQEALSLNWIDLQKRYYDPSLARFLQVDPVTEGQEFLTTYQYSWNNPVLKSDPNGDFCIPCVTALAGAVIGGGINAYDQYKSGELGLNLKSVSRIGTAAVAGGIAGSGFGGITTAVAVSAGGEAVDQLISKGKVENLQKVVINGGAALVAGGMLKGAEALAVKSGLVAAAKSFVASKSSTSVVSNSGKVTLTSTSRQNITKVTTATKVVADNAVNIGSYVAGNKVANLLDSKKGNTTSGSSQFSADLFKTSTTKIPFKN